MFVIELAGVQAVAKFPEELLEHIPLGLVVPVFCGAAGVEMAAGACRGSSGAASAVY